MRTDDSDRIEKSAATSLMTSLALLLTLTLCGPAAVAQSAAFHTNGAFASEFFCSQSQTSIECFNVDVFVGFLFYDHSIEDLNTGAFQDSFGFGTIPNSAFAVQAQTGSLNVDTSTVAGFFNQFCTFDPNTNTFTCNPTPGGVVTGTWTVIRRLATMHFSGTTRFSSPGVISVQTGTSDSQAALANVNVLGAAAANVTGIVGTNHNTTINVQH